MPGRGHISIFIGRVCPSCCIAKGRAICTDVLVSPSCTKEASLELVMFRARGIK